MKTPHEIIKEFYSLNQSLQTKIVKLVKADLKQGGFMRPNSDRIDKHIVEMYPVWSKNKLVSSQGFQYTECMKNNDPINGSIIEVVTVRSGVHQYDEQNRTVVEIAFKGYNTNYIQVVDMNTARSLMNQLRDILPPNYQEL